MAGLSNCDEAPYRLPHGQRTLGGKIKDVKIVLIWATVVLSSYEWR